MRFTPTWTGPYLVRSKVAGSERYLISRSETSATFDAHVTRLRTSPHKTYGLVSLESKAADGQGAGRGYHKMDASIVFEIDKVLEVNSKEALISFMGNEINARWIPRTDLEQQGPSDLLADFLDSSQSTLISGTKTNGLRFTMSQTAVARLEGARTHDGFNRLYFKGPWVTSAQYVTRMVSRAIAYLCAISARRHFMMAAWASRSANASRRATGYAPIAARRMT